MLRSRCAFALAALMLSLSLARALSLLQTAPPPPPPPPRRKLPVGNSTAPVTKFLPLYNCTSPSQVTAQKRRFQGSPIQQDGSACPTWGYFLAALYRSDPRPEDKLMMSVGFNKGYLAVEFLGVWGTVSSKVLTFDAWGKQLSAMHDQGRVVSDYVCGECKECLERLYLKSNVLPRRVEALSRERDLRPKLSLPHFVGVDANPRNVHSLQRIAHTFNLPLLGINALLTNASAPDLWLEPQHWGDPAPFLLPVPAGSSEASPVPVRSLDDLVLEMQANQTLPARRPISILAVNTGSDAQVLLGGDQLLRSGRVRLLVFTWAGNWASRTLQSVVQDLSESMNAAALGGHTGASCYLLGSSKVWKLTSGCYDGVYAQRKGVHVGCVLRGDIWERVLDSMCVRVRPRELASRNK